MANLEGACITREQFLLREMRVACQLRLDGIGNDEIVEKVKADNLIQYPTERMVGNIARVCCKRIDAVDSDQIVHIIASGMHDASAQANLYAMMCTYPLVRDFMENEVGRRFAELDYQLGPVEMGAYITRLQTELRIARSPKSSRCCVSASSSAGCLLAPAARPSFRSSSIPTSATP